MKEMSINVTIWKILVYLVKFLKSDSIFFFPSPALYVIKSSTFMSRNSGGIHVLVKVTRSCLTLWNPMDYTVHGILQARILEWVAFSFSRGSSQPRGWIQVSHIAGRFFNIWATREVCYIIIMSLHNNNYHGMRGDRRSTTWSDSTIIV